MRNYRIIQMLPRTSLSSPSRSLSSRSISKSNCLPSSTRKVFPYSATYIVLFTDESSGQSISVHCICFLSHFVSFVTSLHHSFVLQLTSTGLFLFRAGALTHLNSSIIAMASSRNGPTASGTGGNLKERKIDEHQMDLKDVAAKYETNTVRGLSQAEASQRLIKYGKNMLTPPKQTPEIVKFLKQLAGGFSLLLWFGATLCLIVYTMDSFKHNDPQGAPMDNVRKDTSLVTFS